MSVFRADNHLYMVTLSNEDWDKNLLQSGLFFLLAWGCLIGQLCLDFAILFTTLLLLPMTIGLLFSLISLSFAHVFIFTYRFRPVYKMTREQANRSYVKAYRASFCLVLFGALNTACVWIYPLISATFQPSILFRILSILMTLFAYFAHRAIRVMTLSVLPLESDIILEEPTNEENPPPN